MRAKLMIELSNRRDLLFYRLCIVNVLKILHTASLKSQQWHFLSQGWRCRICAKSNTSQVGSFLPIYCDRPNHAHAHVSARCQGKHASSLCLDLICEVQFCLDELMKHAATRLDGVDLAHDYSASSPDCIDALGVFRQICSWRSFTPHTRQLRIMSFSLSLSASLFQRLFRGEGS